MERSSAGPQRPDLERAERLAKDWIAGLVKRTPLAELGSLPLARLVAEAPPLIVAALEALSDAEKGPAELARAGERLAELFGEGRPAAPGPPAEPGGDRLTGLPGSAALAERLSGLLAEQRRYGHPFSIAVVDVEGLARINEAFGRETGDRVLAAVGTILRRQLRDADQVFRVEEDEFAIVAPHTDAAQLVSVARRVAGQIASAQSAEGPRIAITTGIAGCPADGLGTERLLESATEAVYAAKAAGAAVARSPKGETARR